MQKKNKTLHNVTLMTLPKYVVDEENPKLHPLSGTFSETPKTSQPYSWLGTQKPWGNKSEIVRLSVTFRIPHEVSAARTGFPSSWRRLHNLGCTFFFGGRPRKRVCCRRNVTQSTARLKTWTSQGEETGWPWSHFHSLLEVQFGVHFLVVVPGASRGPTKNSAKNIEKRRQFSTLWRVYSSYFIDAITAVVKVLLLWGVQKRQTACILSFAHANGRSTPTQPWGLQGSLGCSQRGMGLRGLNCFLCQLICHL